jgi:hypothetical protein
MSFSTVTIEGKRATPDRVYYNGTVINNSLTSTQQEDDRTVKFQDQRQTSLIPDASNYELQVQNFSLNGCSKTLPLFIPQINPGPTFGYISSATVNSSGPGQTVTYTYNPITPGVLLQPGNTVRSISGFTNDAFNIYTPTVVVNSTATTFTVASENLPYPATITPIVNSVVVTYIDPNDVTTTIYSVTVGIYDGSTHYIDTQYIKWVPENRAPYTIVPTTANPTQIESDYYYCYTYTHWVSLVNTALRNAWVTCGGGTLCGTQCPFMEYDETTGLFSLNQDSNTCMVPYGNPLPQPYNVTSTTTSASGGTYGTDEYSFVGMNTCLELLLTNFPSIYYSANTPWISTSPQLLLPEVVIDMGLPENLLTTGGSITVTPVGVSLRTQPRTSIFQLVNPFTGTAIADAFYARLPQDYSSTGTIWSPITSFVLVTTQIPVRNEACANPVVFGTSNLGSLQSGGAFQKVLIETPVEALTAGAYRGSILYEPKIESYSSLDPSQDGISDIDISVFWRNRLTNSLVPLRIPNQASMSFRLLFKRKLAI